MVADSLHYFCVPGIVHSRCWGEQCAVYHRESGDTHLINKVDASILQRINEKPISVKDLSVAFEHVFDDGASQYIQALLSNLAELGLIEAIKNESDS